MPMAVPDGEFDLLAMVHLHDLGIVGVGRERGAHPLGQRQHQVDAGGEIRRIDHRDTPRRLGHCRLVRVGQPGAAEHPRLAGPGHRRGVGLRGRGVGEIHHAVGCGGEAADIRQQWRTARSRLVRPGAAYAAGKFGTRGAHLLDQQMPHPAGDPGDTKTDCHVTPPRLEAVILLGPDGRSNCAVARNWSGCAMVFLLTWHGTLLCRRRDGALVHRPLADRSEDAAPVELDMPIERLRAEFSHHLRARAAGTA